jgi:hypothetical protein
VQRTLCALFLRVPPLGCQPDPFSFYKRRT